MLGVDPDAFIDIDFAQKTIGAMPFLNLDSRRMTRKAWF
jgi:hypothetical protein